MGLTEGMVEPVVESWLQAPLIGRMAEAAGSWTVFKSLWLKLEHVELGCTLVLPCGMMGYSIESFIQASELGQGAAVRLRRLVLTFCVFRSDGQRLQRRRVTRVGVHAAHGVFISQTREHLPLG